MKWGMGILFLHLWAGTNDHSPTSESSILQPCKDGNSGLQSFSLLLSSLWKPSSVSGRGFLVGAVTEEIGFPTPSFSSSATTDTIATGVTEKSYPNLPACVRPGILYGESMMALLNDAKEKGYAIPAVNCVSSSGINACLEAAHENDAPIIIQFSSSGSRFYAGRGLDDRDCRASVAGAIAGAFHVRVLAEQWGIPVILHTDHCSKEKLPWVDGLLRASERYFACYGEPLFSSHMLDFSDLSLEENLGLCKLYLKKMAKLDIFLEMELGVTGGEEDGVDNSNTPTENLYSKPDEIDRVYNELKAISDKFTVAAAFGNVHGVYRPGNVKLSPKILHKAQEYICEKLKRNSGKPVFFVFHGGSGSSLEHIQEAIRYGVVKMNIDTDTQWAYWEGLKNYTNTYHDYLQSQIGNPEGSDKPNKKYYDPREFLRAAEKNTIARLGQTFAELNCRHVLGRRRISGRVLNEQTDTKLETGPLIR